MSPYRLQMYVVSCATKWRCERSNRIVKADSEFHSMCEIWRERVVGTAAAG